MKTYKLLYHLTIALFPMVVLLGCGGGTGGAVASGPVLSAVLNQLGDRVDGAIEKAKDAGNSVLLQAGDQANITIQRAKAAYADSLDLTTNKLNPAIQATVDQLNSMVGNLEKQTTQDLQRSLNQAQQIANTIPLSDKNPQVTDFNPKLVPAGDSGTVRISVRGNFFEANQQGFHPVLSIGGKDIDAVGLTTQSLDFDVPDELFLPCDGKHITFNSLTLSLPFAKGLILKDKTLGSFRLLVGSIPSNPGKIMLSHRVVNNVREVQHIVGPTKRVDSSSDDHDFDVAADPIPAEWNVVPSSVQVPITWQQGGQNHDWWLDNLRQSPTPVVHVRTEHHGLGTSGKIEFHFEYDIERYKPSDDWVDEPINLKWGDSIVRPYAPTFWRISFDCFDGSHKEFSSEVSNEKFIRIADNSASVTVGTPSASELVW